MPFEEGRLRLELFGAEGERLVEARCELLLSAWGDSHRVELYPRGNVLQLPLVEPWLVEQWDAGNRRITGRILIRAPGHAPLSSDSFHWLGERVNSGYVERTEIRFPRGQVFVVEPGETVRGRLTLRRSGTRIVSLVDIEDRPLEGLVASVALFWSNENHCGALMGVESLGQFTADAHGQIEIPDGDHEYALSFHTWYAWNDHILEEPRHTYRLMRFIGWLEDETTTIRFRRKEVAPLRLRVTRNGAPVTDVELYTNLGWVGCGATWGPTGRPDADGRILVPEYWYEGMDRIWLQDAAGEKLWSMDPRELDRKSELLVELP